MNDLFKKALIGLIQLQLLLALFLFLPAGSLRYWEAWVYWALFTLSVLLITLYFLKHDPALIERRMKAGPGAEQRKTQKIIQAGASVSICALFLVPGFDYRFRWSSVPTPVALAADLVMVLGMLIVFRVFKENSYTASTIQVEADQQVVSTGPYAWVRHPMYAGSDLVFLATPFALGSLWALLPALLLFGVIAARLLDEERYLSQNLPGYDAYLRKVRYRLIPFIW